VQYQTVAQDMQQAIKRLRATLGYETIGIIHYGYKFLGTNIKATLDDHVSGRNALDLRAVDSNIKPHPALVTEAPQEFPAREVASHSAQLLRPESRIRRRWHLVGVRRSEIYGISEDDPYDIPPLHRKGRSWSTEHQNIIEGRPISVLPNWDEQLLHELISFAPTDVQIRALIPRATIPNILADLPYRAAGCEWLIQILVTDPRGRGGGSGAASTVHSPVRDRVTVPQTPRDAEDRDWESLEPEFLAFLKARQYVVSRFGEEALSLHVRICNYTPTVAFFQVGDTILLGTLLGIDPEQRGPMIRLTRPDPPDGLWTSLEASWEACWDRAIAWDWDEQLPT
jgi:hypothetical protein